VCLTCFASLYGALSGISEVVTDDTEFIFLALFTTSSNSIPSFLSFMALLGPFVGLTLGFDAINSERSRGTLNRLLAQPIHRDSVINGKFLAGSSVIFIMVFSMGIIVGAIGFLAIGIPPGGEEIARIIIFLLFTCFYIMFWLALSILFSVVCKHSATSALLTVAAWLFFAIFTALLAGIIANALYPLNDMNAAANTLSNYTAELNFNRISPYYLYSESTSTILNPNIRSVSIVTLDQFYGAIAGYLSLGQSLLLVWPHLVALIALTMICFAVSYVLFMKQEVRGD
jgi:ABC-2 type transport system permease protein